MFKIISKTIKTYALYLLLLTIGTMILLVNINGIDEIKAGCWDCMIHLQDPGCPDPGYAECRNNGDYGTYWLGDVGAKGTGVGDTESAARVDCGFRIEAPAYPDPINHYCNRNPDNVDGICYAIQASDTQCPAPASMTGSCTTSGLSFDWSDVSGTNRYALRFDKSSPSWNGSCSSPNGGDFCNDAYDASRYPTSDTTTGDASVTYTAWAHSVNSNGVLSSGSASSTVSCPASTAESTPLAVDCSVTPSGNTATWTGRPSGGTGPFTYTWAGTDDLSGRTGNPVTVTYTSPGTKTGAVTVTDSTGATRTSTNACSFTISSTPTVTCSATPNPATAGKSVTWTASASGGSGTYSSYSWSGTASGLGTTASVTKSSGYTAQSTQYASTVTVTDSNGVTSSSSNNCYLQVNPPSQPDLIVDSLSPTSAVNGSSVTFSGRVLNQGGGSATATNAVLRIASTAGGTLNPTLTPNQSVNSLAADGSQTVTWSSAWTASGVGNHPYQICVTSVTNESDTSNNCTSGTIQVTASAVFDFSLSTPNNITVTQNGSAGSGNTTVSKIGAATSESVTLSIDPSTPLPSGATVLFSNNPCTPNTTCLNTLAITPNSASPGTYQLRLKGTSSSISTGRFSGYFDLIISPPSGSSVPPPPPPTTSGTYPWIQTTGGDVHSNTKIDVP